MRQRRWPRSRYVRVMGASLLVGFLVSLVSIPTRADERQDCDRTQALALVNGKIHTMDAKNSVVSSVLIRNGKFVEVGRRASDGDGRCTKTINLHGRTAVPGIIDNHNHIILLGLRPGHDTRLENANSIQCWTRWPPGRPGCPGASGSPPSEASDATSSSSRTAWPAFRHCRS